MSELPKGEKLRRALILTWLSSKYDADISKAELTRIIGYKKTGIYSATEAGWFIEKDGRTILSEKGLTELKRDALPNYESYRQLIFYLSIFSILILVQSILYTYFKTVLILTIPLYGAMSSLAFICIYIFYYRLVWIVQKRKINDD